MRLEPRRHGETAAAIACVNVWMVVLVWLLVLLPGALPMSVQASSLVSPETATFTIRQHDPLAGVVMTPWLRYSPHLPESATLADALALRPADWLEVPGSTPSFGLVRTAYWFRLQLDSDSRGARSLYLAVSYALLNHLDVYLVAADGSTLHYQTGNSLPFSSRPVAHRHFLFPIEIGPREALTVLVRAQTRGALQVPVTLWDQTLMWVSDQVSLPAHSFFAAVMLTIILLNLLLFLGASDRLFLHYACYVLMIALAQLGLRGVNYQFLWPEWPRFNQDSLVVFMGGAVACGALFVDRFLTLREHSWFMHQCCRLLVALGALSAASVLLLDYASAIAVAIPLAALACLVMLVAGIVVWSRGSRQGAFYTVAWSFFLVGMFASLLAKLGWIPRTDLIEYGPEFGAALEVILLTFAITDRMNEERRLRMVAQDIALENAAQMRRLHEDNLSKQEETNRELEATVEMRVSEMRYALQELSEAHEKLRNLSTLDGLTQLRNRRHFDEAYRREWERAEREGTELSLMILDADLFKQINDTYGHIAGDDCLKALARVLEKQVRRPADTLARYGGEEFVVILPGSDHHGVLRLSENIRIEIEDHPVDFEGRQIPLTVSIGAAYCSDVRNHKPADLFALADRALYEAKQSGRNRVVIRELV